MPAPRAVTAATLLLAATLALAACGDDGDASNDDAPDIGGASESSTAPEPTTESTKGPEAIPTSYPDVGLEYVDFPEPTEKTRPALEVFVAFNHGRVQLLHEAAMNDEVRDNAAAPVVEMYQSTADYLQEHNAFYRGDTVATVTDLVTKGDFVALDMCVDGSALRFVENGESGPVEGPARVPFRTIVTRTDTGWTVTEAMSQEGSC